MRDAFIERLGAGVLSHSQFLPASDASQAPGTSDQEEAERPHAAQGIGLRPFPRRRLGGGRRLKLEAPEQIVGQDTELLPRAVGAVVMGRDHIQGELPLEFGLGLLLRPPASYEGPEGGGAQGLVGGHGRVLAVSIIRGEELQLEVLPGRMPDPLAVDHHPQGQPPGRQGQPDLEGTDIGGDPLPVPLGGHQRLQPTQFQKPTWMAYSQPSRRRSLRISRYHL